MEDERIVALYWERSEAALQQTQKKYDAYCVGIAGRILPNQDDARECFGKRMAACDSLICATVSGILLRA